MKQKTVYGSTLRTPLGPLTYTHDGHRLISVDLKKEFSGPFVRKPLSLFENEIKGYFSGKTRVFKTPINLEKISSPFIKKVLLELKKVPYGKTLSYGQLAAKAGRPKAQRAAGMACGRNPLMLVIPCHRILRSDGGIGGFAGGISVKRKLLNLEGLNY